MNDYTGLTLSETLRILQETNSKIVKVEKLIGTNSKFNKLDKPYVIRSFENEENITLYVTYY